MNKKKQNVIDVKRFAIRKLNQTIDTNTYILTFNKPKPPPEIKIHRADSKLGKIWEKESEILKIKVTQKISFLETRRLVEMLFIKPTFVKITKLIQMKTK